MLSFVFVVGVIVLGTFYTFKWNQSASSKSYPCPPGPWGLPILGHLPLLGIEPWIKLMEWKALYGPIISIQFANVPTVVIQDVKLIKAAFSLNVFSDRPTTEAFRKFSFGYKGLFFAPYDTVSEQRRFIQTHLRDFGYNHRDKMEAKIMEEIKESLDCLQNDVERTQKQSPQVPINMKNRFSAPILNAAWGIIMSKKFKAGDPDLQKIVDSVRRATSSHGMLADLAMFASWLVDWIPRLSGIAGQIEGFNNVYRVMDDHIQLHDRSRIPNQPRDLTDLYRDKVDQTDDPSSSFHISDKQQPVTTGDLFMGAVDTTTATLKWFLVFMVQYPQVQEKLFQEIKEITGNFRSPSLADIPNMKYAAAVIEELLRLSSINPFAFFHYTKEDVSFEGYFIPKDTMIIANTYGVHYDPETWDEPYKFKPERFLKLEDGGYQEKPNVRSDVLAFSWGKRMCPGENLARFQLFLYTTNLVQKFRFECWADGEMPSAERNPGFVCPPKDEFKQRICIRSC